MSTQESELFKAGFWADEDVPDEEGDDGAGGSSGLIGSSFCGRVCLIPGPASFERRWKARPILLMLVELFSNRQKSVLRMCVQ